MTDLHPPAPLRWVMPWLAVNASLTVDVAADANSSTTDIGDPHRASGSGFAT